MRILPAEVFAKPVGHKDEAKVASVVEADVREDAVVGIELEVTARIFRLEVHGPALEQLQRTRFCQRSARQLISAAAPALALVSKAFLVGMGLGAVDAEKSDLRGCEVRSSNDNRVTVDDPHDARGTRSRCEGDDCGRQSEYNWSHAAVGGVVETMWALCSSGLVVDACFIVMLAGVAVCESVRVLRRCRGPKSSDRILSPNRQTVFISAKSFERGVAEVVLRGPRQKGDLDDELRGKPHRFAEVLSGRPRLLSRTDKSAEIAA